MENKLIKILIITIQIYFTTTCAAQSYTYDDLNRLTEVDYGSGVTINYTYDNLGNRTQYVVNGDCIDLSTINGTTETNFEAGLSAWVQNTADDANWTLYEGSTQSSNTGPPNAAVGDQYLYTEASGGNTNKSFVIESPCFDMSQIAGANFKFDYHMFGSGTGSLKIDISTNGGSSYTNLVPEINGSQGNNWLNSTSSLSSYLTNNVKIRITAVTGSTFRSDIAIDNIVIEISDCPQNLTVTNITQSVYESQNNINTSGTVIVTPGSNVEFKSNTIDLNSGFEVKQNAVFTIINGPCSN